MNTNEHESEKERLDSVAEAVIGAAYEVSNVLGAGFLEKVYERALIRELALRGLAVKSQVSYSVAYKGQRVGEYVADLLVENQVVIELKCVDRFSNEHVAQCINYLRASHLRLALLINFQKPKVVWKRIIYG
jgi:GxxExxY protein